MEIQVCSKKVKGNPKYPTVYVGRPTLFGNPYAIGRDGTRDMVIAKYRAWLWDHIKRDTGVRKALELLLANAVMHNGVNLECWCAPEACHADVLKSALHWMDACNIEAAHEAESMMEFILN